MNWYTTVKIYIYLKESTCCVFLCDTRRFLYWGTSRGSARVLSLLLIIMWNTGISATISHCTSWISVILSISWSEVVFAFWILGIKLWLPFSFVTAVGLYSVSWDTLYFFFVIYFYITSYIFFVIQVLPGKSSPLYCRHSLVHLSWKSAEQGRGTGYEWYREGWGTWYLLCFGLYP